MEIGTAACGGRRPGDLGLLCTFLFSGLGQAQAANCRLAPILADVLRRGSRRFSIPGVASGADVNNNFTKLCDWLIELRPTGDGRGYAKDRVGVPHQSFIDSAARMTRL